jgi:hypothetical protein
MLKFTERLLKIKRYNWFRLKDITQYFFFEFISFYSISLIKLITKYIT